jgi:hypothetical protein
MDDEMMVAPVAAFKVGDNEELAVKALFRWQILKPGRPQGQWVLEQPL